MLFIVELHSKPKRPPPRRAAGVIASDIGSEQLIDAMKQDVVAMSIRYVRDQQKNIKDAKVESIDLLE